MSLCLLYPLCLIHSVQMLFSFPYNLITRRIFKIWLTSNFCWINLPFLLKQRWSPWLTIYDNPEQSYPAVSIGTAKYVQDISTTSCFLISLTFYIMIKTEEVKTYI